MKSIPQLLPILLCALLLASAESAHSETTEERLNRVERTLSGGALMKLLQLVENLQRELRELRGQVEMQAHTLSQIKQTQKDSHLDLDKRLQEIEPKSKKKKKT